MLSLRISYLGLCLNLGSDVSIKRALEGAAQLPRSGSLTKAIAPSAQRLPHCGYFIYWDKEKGAACHRPIREKARDKKSQRKIRTKRQKGYFSDSLRGFFRNLQQTQASCDTKVNPSRPAPSASLLLKNIFILRRFCRRPLRTFE